MLSMGTDLATRTEVRIVAIRKSSGRDRLRTGLAGTPTEKEIEKSQMMETSEKENKNNNTEHFATITEVRTVATRKRGERDR